MYMYIFNYMKAGPTGWPHTASRDAVGMVIHTIAYNYAQRPPLASGRCYAPLAWCHAGTLLLFQRFHEFHQCGPTGPWTYWITDGGLVSSAWSWLDPPDFSFFWCVDGDRPIVPWRRHRRSVIQHLRVQHPDLLLLLDRLASFGFSLHINRCIYICIYTCIYICTHTYGTCGRAPIRDRPLRK